MTSYGNKLAAQECDKQTGPYYPEPDMDAPVRKNNFNKKISNSTRKFEVLNSSLDLVHKKLLLTVRSDETTRQDAVDEFERFIKYCEDYKNELISAINNDIMEDVVK